jgi:IS5 family transposase
VHIVQPPLLSYNEFFQLDQHDRLLLVLETINAEALLKTLDVEHQRGPTEYRARSLWSILIAGVVYQIPSVPELRRHLATNPYLRFLCGISPQKIPSESTFSRFLGRLVKHEDLLQACIDDLVRRFAVLAPGFGEQDAADSTDVLAYARGKKEGAADPDARWGVKGCQEGNSKGKGGRSFTKDGKYHWFGYKLHLLVDAKYEIPIAFQVTAANESDTKYFEPLLKERDRLLPEVRLKWAVADAGYDSKDNCLAVRRRGGAPIIPLNLRAEKSPPDATTPLGTPLCPVGLPMVYWGRDGKYLKYRCPQVGEKMCCLIDHQKTDQCSLSPYKMVLKVRMDDDPRRYVPIPRETKKWARLYKLRGSAERVNSRLKEHLMLDELHVRRIDKVRCRLSLSVLVMLAVAVGMAERNHLDRVRSLTRLAA